MANLVDYTKQFKEHTKDDGVLLAQGRGKHLLILYKLKELRKISGVNCRYMIEYRELSTVCEHSDDEAFVCVWYSETNFYQRKEIKYALDAIKKNDLNLFDHFHVL